ncbi:MAG: polysaccharide deacetylase family protein [Halofilum sp. (in: g-proteobacteria)]
MRILSIVTLAASLGVAAAGSSPTYADANAYSGALIDDFNAAHPERAIDDPPQVRARPAEVVEHGPREGEKARIALTFDACSQNGPNHINDELIEKLRADNVPATMFLGGLWMADNPELTASIHDDPLFELANHAHGHPDLTEMTEREVRVQLGFAQLMAYSLTGETPRYFRAPFVEYNDTVTDVAGELGLSVIQYDIASGDADEDLGAEEIAAHVLDRARPGSIVVLHMHDPDLATAEAIDLILAGLRERELEPVTIGELLED